MPDSPAEITARALLDAGAFLIRPEQPFKLTSGLLAPFYVNCRQIIFHPEARGRIADAQAVAIHKALPGDAVEVIAGGVTAGVPFATMVADRLSLPLVYVRPEPKGHGLGAQIEGGEVAGKRVLLVEDLITTAGSILKFVGALRAAGARVSDVSVVFTRAGDSARAALAEAGLRLHAVCELDTLLKVARATGVTNDAALAEVRAFLADPEGWSKKRDAA
ncbi:MAG: orotate phosphoribosyltransferase [Alphaproteobacteria bacterium]|nr:orotate phosphoribosyltransferase [Alphaproteobacteria bacterium]